MLLLVVKFCRNSKVKGFCRMPTVKVLSRGVTACVICCTCTAAIHSHEAALYD